MIPQRRQTAMFRYLLAISLLVLVLFLSSCESVTAPNGVDDVDDIGVLGVSRRLWVPCSIPIEASGGEAVSAADRQLINWYNPEGLVVQGDLFPDLPQHMFDDPYTVLAVRDYHANDGTWAGLMRLLSRTGNDYSGYQFFELWIDAGADPVGTIHIDLGTINEDFYPLRQPNGILDSEDVDVNGFDADEDTGLDNVWGYDGQGVPGDDGDDDYWFEYGSGDYSHINGTEGNESLDTDDLNGNFYIDTANHFWRLTVNLADTAYLAVDNSTYEDPDKQTDWRLYRIPLEQAINIGGMADWLTIKSARIWFEGLSIAEEHVLIGALDIVRD